MSSPEQALGQTLDARSDVFSFGATLYEALSGQRAFSGDSILDTLNAVVSREPEPLDTSHASRIPPDGTVLADKSAPSVSELCHMPPKPRSNAVVYGDTWTHIDVA